MTMNPEADGASEVVQVRTASDGHPLHYRHWPPQGLPRGWMLTLHGIQSHSGWYLESARRFAACGWNVRVPDRRGSGLNSGKRGDAPHWRRLVNDVRHFLFDIHRERDERGIDAPIVISGISWGGKLALLLAREYPDLIDGLSLITPGIFSRFNPGSINRLRIAVARSLGLSARRIPIPLCDPTLFTSDQEQQCFIKNDPLALHEMTLSLLFASQDLDQRIQRPGKINIPVQLLLAEQDQIIDNSRTKRFLRERAAAGLETTVYPQVRHTLELEHCRDQFIHDWIMWAESMPGRGTTSSPEHRHSGPEIPAV